MKTIINVLKTGLKKRAKSDKLRQKLLQAIDQKDEALIELLINSASQSMVKKALNPKVDYRTTSYTEDPLHFAIRNRLVTSVTRFLPYIKDINRQPYAVGTPLHAASQHGLVEVVKLLLERDDIDLEARNYAYGEGRFGRDRKNRTALSTLREYMAMFGETDKSRREISKLLLQAVRASKA